MTDTAKEVERPKLVSCEADADFGEGWYLYRLYDADVVDAELAALRVKLGEAEKRAEEQWDCVMSQSCGLAYDYKGKFFTNARAERSEALVGKLKPALEAIADGEGEAQVIAKSALKACEGGQ